MMCDVMQSIAKKHKFSTSLSCQRLRSLQNLLKRDGNSTDGILVVLGVDGKFNEGSRELANFLTFGFFSVRQNDLEKAGLEEEDIEDVLFFIRQDSVSLYCGSLLYNYLLPYVMHWKNLQLYCRSEDDKNEIRDTDVEEKYKVKSFVSMLKKSNVIGIPYTGSAATQGGKTDTMTNVEKWPLMQSYASKDIGVNKSFLLDYSVVNVRNLLLPIYNQCDPFVFEETASKSYNLFHRHWDEATSVIQNAVKSKSILEIKEEQVLEPLLCYFKHGQIAKHGKKGVSSDSPLKPYVLFGNHTLELDKDSNLKNMNIKSMARKGKSLPYHMAIQCIAPNCPLVCARTYFFKSKSNVNDKEFNDLVSLYTACIESASIGISEYMTCLDTSKAQRKVVEHLLSKGVATSLVFDAKCKVMLFDKSGKVQIKDEKLYQNMTVVHVAMENIKTSHGGDAIGSLVFCDTFMVSSYQILHGVETNSDSQLRSICNVLTADIPSYNEWPLESVKSDYKFDGEESLAYCKDLIVCSNSLLYSPSYKANIRFNQDGTVYLNTKNMDDLLVSSGIQYYDGLSPGKVCILVINFDLPENSASWSRIPAQCRGEVNIIPDIALSSASKCMVLALMPGSQAYKEFYACVIHAANPPDAMIKQMKVLSPDLENMYTKIQEVHQKRLFVTKETFKKRVSVKTANIREFVLHQLVSTVADGLPVPLSTASILLDGTSIIKNEDKETEDEKIPVTIIAGLPSSGAENISQQLVMLNKEKVRWVVIRPNNDESLTDFVLQRENLEAQLAQAVSHKRVARPSAAARKKLRIIVLAIGFFDLCEIVQCITHHQDEAVRKQLLVGAVTTCIWPKSINYTERQNYPKFFGQCLPGVVSNFALFVPDDDMAMGDSILSKIQALLRCVNKQAAFLLCPGGKLVRKSDFELVLAEDNFMSAKMQKERFMIRPALSLGIYESKLSNPSVSKVSVGFSQPLIKGTFCARLRGLKASLALHQPTGGVCFVSGCVAFTDSPTQEYDISFASAMDEVALNPKIQHSTLPTPPPTSRGSSTKSKPYNLEFQGLDLNKDALMDWLRKCGRQKPSKKCHKTKQHLTKDEIQMIHEENCTRRLPEGYFYNGSFYVSLFDNNKMLHHPNMTKFIDEYLKDENKEIDAYNAEIDRQNIKDVFEV